MPPMPDADAHVTLRELDAALTYFPTLPMNRYLCLDKDVIQNARDLIAAANEDAIKLKREIVDLKLQVEKEREHVNKAEAKFRAARDEARRRDEAPLTAARDSTADELNALCGTYGCPAGMDRIVWLRERLRELTRLRAAASEANTRTVVVSSDCRSNTELDWPLGSKAVAPSDGFVGTVIGYYCTREGNPGVVLQQLDTKVVHVYRATRLAKPLT